MTVNTFCRDLIIASTIIETRMLQEASLKFQYELGPMEPMADRSGLLFCTLLKTVE